MIISDFPITALTPNDGKHYWFGYYDVCPWNQDQNRLLGLRSDFMDHSPEPGEKAEIFVIDPENQNELQKAGETLAWNWQMSSRLQWMPDNPNTHIFYNDRRDKSFVGVIHDLNNGKEQILPQAIYAVSRDGKFGATLNFSRLHNHRPGYGYNGLPDPNADCEAPDNDGIYVVNMNTGQSNLIVSYPQLLACAHTNDMDGNKHWVNHIFWGPNDNRILFYHRWRDPQMNCTTRIMVCDPDGSNLTCLGRGLCSHYDWQHDHEILIYAGLVDEKPGYYLVNDPSGNARLLSNRFERDGHCSWSPDKQWMLSDTYPGGPNNEYSLFIYHVENDKIITLATLPHPKKLPGDCRCDLHPRWSRDGKQICFDGAPDGYRQLFVINLKNLTE
jgi:Tol biopolymer transport system component